jgi:hypothetical protein
MAFGDCLSCKTARFLLGNERSLGEFPFSGDIHRSAPPVSNTAHGRFLGRFFLEGLVYRLRLTGGFAAFEPFGLLPATRAAVRKNESSRFAFFLPAKAANRTFLNLKNILKIPFGRRFWKSDES